MRPARRPEVVRELSFAQAAHPAIPPLAVSLVVAVLTAPVLPLRWVWSGPVFAVMVLMAAVLAQWPGRGELFPIALAISLYTVAVTMSRATALVATALAVAVEAPRPARAAGMTAGWPRSTRSSRSRVSWSRACT